jgi:hypothetical protein
MSKRECGDCSECCVHLPINDAKLQKPRQTPCVHLCKGCAIYKDRPPVCKGYQCYWLSGELPEYLKPNQTGLLFGHKNTDSGSVIQITEREPGVIDANWERCRQAVLRINQRRQAKGQSSQRAAVFLYATGISAAHTYAINSGVSLASAKEKPEPEQRDLALRGLMPLSLAV